MRPKNFKKLTLIITMVLVLACLTGISVYAGNGGNGGAGCECRYENQFNYCGNCGVCGICDPDCDGIPDRDRLRDRILTTQAQN